MDRLSYNNEMFTSVDKYSNGGAVEACKILNRILDELEILYEIDKKLIVSLYYIGYQSFTEIYIPKDGDVIDLDFSGDYMIQVVYKNKEFELTGNGMDGRGDALNAHFYEKCIIE